MPDPIDYKHDVFISYSHKDKEWVCTELLPRLEAVGLQVVIDYRDFKIGVPILINIERAVDESRHVLLVLSPAWLDSECADFESLLGGTKDPAGRRSRLIPLLYQSCELPTRLDALTCADFTEVAELEFQFKHLLEQLTEDKNSTAKFAPLDDSSFVAGPPISKPRQFFGRDYQVRRLFNLVKKAPMQNGAIIAPRRSGKTSLLLYLKMITKTAAADLRVGQRNDYLPQAARYHWIFVDFQDVRLGRADRLMTYLLQQMQFPIPNPCTIESFMNTVSQHLREPTIILMDEIDVALKTYKDMDLTFWNGLRSLATNQSHGLLGFILAAHQSPYELAHENNVGSPFFNIFGYTTSLGPLGETEARDLIASSPVEITSSDVDWILSQSKRWPILLQILCRERLVALEEKQFDEQWQESALEQMRPFQHLLEFGKLV